MDAFIGGTSGGHNSDVVAAAAGQLVRSGVLADVLMVASRSRRGVVELKSPHYCPSSRERVSYGYRAYICGSGADNIMRREVNKGGGLAHDSCACV